MLNECLSTLVKCLNSFELFQIFLYPLHGLIHLFSYLLILVVIEEIIKIGNFLQLFDISNL